MVKKIILGVIAVILAAIIGVVIAASLQPTEFTVTRSEDISAPPEQVFPHINNLKKWDAWSPWDKLDPNMQKTYEGPDAGEGASYSWDGNDEVGAGSLTITKSDPNKRVDMHLKFVRPWEDECNVDFQLTPDGKTTEVSWTMHGENDFMGKVMCLFMDMDAMVGTSFEEGLAELKKVAEKPAESQDSTDQ